MAEDSKDTRLRSDVEPGPMTEKEQAEFFNRPIIARLATKREDGYPWDGEGFWFVIREKAQFIPNLLGDPRVCVSIATDSHPYARATIVGRAEVVARPGESDEWQEVARKMTRRYVGDVDEEYYTRTLKYPRWLVRVTSEEMTTWRGGGWRRRYTED
jgi:hypothetical protein